MELPEGDQKIEKFKDGVRLAVVGLLRDFAKEGLNFAEAMQKVVPALSSIISDPGEVNDLRDLYESDLKEESEE